VKVVREPLNLPVTAVVIDQGVTAAMGTGVKNKHFVSGLRLTLTAKPLSSDLARQTHWHLSGWTEKTGDQEFNPSDGSAQDPGEASGVFLCRS
jgi:hypothetical protein